jgi:hypothetical protein
VPYSPPAGNAANFNFSGGGYSPPLGSAANFPFGATPTPPSAQGPSRRNALFFDGRRDIERVRRRFAPILAPAPVVLSGPRQGYRADLYQHEPIIATWLIVRRSRVALPAMAARVRPVLFCIT